MGYQPHLSIVKWISLCLPIITVSASLGYNKSMVRPTIALPLSRTIPVNSLPSTNL